MNILKQKAIKTKYKILTFFLVLFVVLPVLFYAVFRMAPVQTYITQKVASYLSKQLNTEITVGGVDISWFLDVVIEDVVVKDLKKNNLLNVKKVIVDVKNINFAKNHISIDNICLNKASINIYKYKGEKDFNFQFIADYFKNTDTTTKVSKPWSFDVSSLKISQTLLTFQDLNKDIKETGIDFSNLKLADLNASISGMKIKGDTISANIENISFTDRSKFQINKLAGVCSFAPSFLKIDKLCLKTNKSDIALDLDFEYKSLADFNDFIDKVKIDVKFQHSLINIGDIAFFVPSLMGMNDFLDINGQFRGKISNLKGRNIEFKTGKNTFFKGDFSITGLPDVEDMYINFNAKQFATNLADINNFKLPGFSQSLKLPVILSKLGYIQFAGNFSGFYRDFVAYGNFKTSIGSLHTDLSLKTNAENVISYKGNVALSDFNLGKMLDDEKKFGKISLDFQLNGSGLDFETVDVEMNGTISSGEIMNYMYKNISIAGNLADKTFSGYIAIKEPNIDLNFEGIVDMRKDLPVFDFSSNINFIKLNKLNITEKGVDREISAYMKSRFKGNNIEDISGIFLLSDLVYKENNKTIVLKNLQINNVSEANHYKNIVLNSDIFDANFEGNFTFADLPASFKGFINNYLPSYQKDSLLIKDTSISTNLRYDIKFKSTNTLTQFFIPDLIVSDDFNLYGNFNYEKDYLSLDGSSREIKYNDNILDNWYVKGFSHNNIFSLKTGADKLNLLNNYVVDNFAINTNTKEDSILFDFKWFNRIQNTQNSGDIAGFFSLEKYPFIKLKLAKGNILTNDSLWVVDANNYIYFDSTSIKVNDLIFKHNNQVVGINGLISGNPEHKLELMFNTFDISDFNPLLVKSGIQLKGIVSGKVSLFDIYKSINFESDIKITSLDINNDKLGNLTLKSSWDNMNKRLIIYSEIIYVGAIGEKKPFKISGYYYPYAEKDNFDMVVNFNDFSLKMIQNYLSSFSSDLRGLAYGDLTIKGTLAKPLINGNLNLRRAGIKIDYLNTTFNFSDNIIIKDNMILFDSLVLNDIYSSNTAVLNGAIYHNNFKDINLDLNFKMKNLLCLNTTASQNNMYYGTAFASGTCHIHGPVENIVIDVFAKTEHNTKFYLPLSSAQEVSENTYIKFITKDTSKTTEATPLEVNLNGIQLNFDLEVTSDAEVQIIFDSKIGDIIKAKGNGDLKMNINTLGDFNMFGDYIIEKGDYLFTLQNFINKRFEIQKGSQISWTGDPYKAVANIEAIYNLRTPLHDLVFLVDSSAEYKKRMPVNCLLGMKGNLFNPDISFGIELPGAEEKTKSMVSTLINTDAEVNRQMFALLALNRFLPPANLNEFSNINIGTGLEATSTELLSNQLSNWLSQISKDFDVGVNYRAGNAMSSDEVEVALSTQLFNDRLSVDGSVGNNGNKQNTSQIVGDVNVELKLTEEGKFRMKFYNKSNSVDMLKANSLYTQGVGLFYRKEFDNFGELFRKK